MRLSSQTMVISSRWERRWKFINHRTPRSWHSLSYCSSIVEHYERLLGFDPVEGATHAVIRPEFVRMSRSEPPQHMSAAERGIVKDVIFRGNHLDVVVDVGGIPIVTERSLEKRSGRDR